MRQPRPAGWPGKVLRLYRNGVDAGAVTGPKLTLSTATGEILTLAPDGTTYAAIIVGL